MWSEVKKRKEIDWILMLVTVTSIQRKYKNAAQWQNIKNRKRITNNECTAQSRRRRKKKKRCLHFFVCKFPSLLIFLNMCVDPGMMLASVIDFALLFFSFSFCCSFYLDGEERKQNWYLYWKALSQFEKWRVLF